MIKKERKNVVKKLIKDRSFILGKQKYTVLFYEQIEDNCLMNEILGRGFLVKVGTLGSIVKKDGLTWRQFVTKKRKGERFPGPKSTCYEILKNLREF